LIAILRCRIDFKVRGVLRQTGREIKVSGGVIGRCEIVLRILSPKGGQIPAFLKAEVIFFAVKLLRQALRNKGQKERFVIKVCLRLFVKNVFTSVEYTVNSRLKQLTLRG
jgi:hypothetical protein